LKEKNKNKEENPTEEKHKCSGYIAIGKGEEPHEHCDEETDGSLWIYHRRERKFFCKASHVLRFIEVYYCNMGEQPCIDLEEQGLKKRKGRKEATKNTSMNSDD